MMRSILVPVFLGFLLGLVDFFYRFDWLISKVLIKGLFQILESIDWTILFFPVSRMIFIWFESF